MTVVRRCASLMSRSVEWILSSASPPHPPEAGTATMGTHQALGGSYHLAHWPRTHSRWLEWAPDGGRSWGILMCVRVEMCVWYQKQAFIIGIGLLTWILSFVWGPQATYWDCVYVCECLSVTVNALSLSMLNSALKCSRGWENRPKSPEFHFNVHLLIALLHRQRRLTFFRQEDIERREWERDSVCKAAVLTDEQRHAVTNDRPGQADRDNETVKGNGGF